jgi:hypothetical protein
MTASPEEPSVGIDPIAVSDGFAVCPGKCPTGTITSTGKLSGRSITVAFDGTAQAAVTGPRGRTFKVPLICAKE